MEHIFFIRISLVKSSNEGHKGYIKFLDNESLHINLQYLMIDFRSEGGLYRYLQDKFIDKGATSWRLKVLAWINVERGKVAVEVDDCWSFGDGKVIFVLF